MKKELIIVQTFDKDGFLTGYKVNGELVRCRDCEHTCREDDHEIWCTGRGSPCQLVAPDGFCDKGRRSE